MSLRRRSVVIAMIHAAMALAACSSGPGNGSAGSPVPSPRDALLRLMPSGSNLLYVPVSGIGSGQVTSSDVQLGFLSDEVFEKSDVRGVYWAYVPTGHTVTLGAVASPGSRFAGWYGTCAGTGSCTVNLGGNVDLAVEFDPLPAAPRTSFTLTVDALSAYRNLHPQIAILPSTVSLDCSADARYVLACSATVPAGTQITLTAGSDPLQPEFSFQGWGGQCSGTGACVVTMDRDVSVTAGFATGATQPVSTCTVPNGSGTRAWTGTAYGPCTVTACDAGFADCDGVAANGCEANLRSDAGSCGACGVSCGAGGTCTAGVCVASACNAFSGSTAASWEVVASMLSQGAQPGWSDFADAVDGSFYSVGGNSLVRYTPSTNAWVSLASPPVSVQSWTSPASVGGALYVIGSGVVQRYTIATDTWTTLLTGVNAAYTAQNAHDDAGNVYTLASSGAILRYSIATNTVTTLTPGVAGFTLSEPRLVYDACSRLLVISPNFDGGGLYAYDPVTNVRTQLPSNPDGIVNDAFCSDRSGHVYAAGAPSGTQFWQYTIASGTWQRIPAMPFDHGFNGACVVTSAGYLYEVPITGGTVARIRLY